MEQLFLGKSLQKPGAQEVSHKRVRVLKNALVGSGGFGSTRQEASTAHPVAKTNQGVENGACEMRGWRSLC
jgi:hypothetical protein